MAENKIINFLSAAYNVSMLNIRTVIKTDTDIDDFIYGDYDPGPSGR